MPKNIEILTQKQVSGDNSVNIQGKNIIITVKRTESSQSKDDHLFMREILELNPDPKFYFWRSEGKSSHLRKLLDRAFKFIKSTHPNKLPNLYYYYGLHYLQEGSNSHAIRCLKEFIKSAAPTREVHLMALLHLGKAYFYSGNYRHAEHIWAHIKKRLGVLPEELRNYCLASITWREYLISNRESNNVSRISMKRLLQATDRAGNSQVKNFWFSLAYSELLNNQPEESILSINSLKEKLVREFRQPLFMIASLLVEARALSSMGEQERRKSKVILSTLSELKVNWNSQLFLNNFCTDIPYLTILGEGGKLASENESGLMDEEIRSYKKNSVEVKYIYDQLPISMIKPD